MYDGTSDGKLYGRKRDLSAVGCLGLVLMWYHTRGSCARLLALIFGQSSTPMYTSLKFGRKVLLFTLLNGNDAKIAHTTNEEVRFYQNTIGDKYPNVSEVWAAADDLKYTFECPGLDSEQNKFYNGWTHNHYIHSVFVFFPA